MASGRKKARAKHGACGVGSIALYCRCLDLNKDSGPLVYCDLCDRWFHEPCVTVDLSDDEAEGMCFMCRDCNRAKKDVMIGKDRLDILFKERKEKRQRAVEEDMSIPAIIRKKPRTEITSSPAMATRASREQKHVHFVLNNISPRSLSKDKCPCGKLKGGTWIQCDKCDQWMHVDCVDMAEPIEMDDAFFCPLCRSENPPDPRAVKIMIEPSINLEKRDLGHRVDKGAVGKRGVGRREAVAAAERVEEAGEGRSVGMEKDKVKEEEETTPKAEVFLPNVFVMGRRWHPSEGGDSKAEETCTSHVGTAGTGKDKNDGEVTVKKGDVERKKVDE